MLPGVAVLTVMGLLTVMLTGVAVVTDGVVVCQGFAVVTVMGLCCQVFQL